MKSHHPVSSTSAVELIKLDIYSPALWAKSGPEEVARKILRANSGPEESPGQKLLARKMQITFAHLGAQDYKRYRMGIGLVVRGQYCLLPE